MTELTLSQALVALEALTALFLVALFRLLYARLRSERFLLWWGWAWTAYGFSRIAYLAALLVPPGSLPQELALLGYSVAGLLQVPLLVLGAESLPRSKPIHALRARLLLWATAGIAVILSLLSLDETTLGAHAFRAFPRQVLLTLAYGYCAWACLRWWRQTVSRGALITGVACAAYGLLHAFSAANLLPWNVGKPYPEYASLATVLCQTGIALGMVFLLLDEHRRAVEDRRESDARFGGAVENLSEGLLITDTNDIVLYVNQRLAEWVGYAREEMIGKPSYSLLVPPHQWPLMWKKNQGRMQGRSEIYELEIRRKDGSPLWVEVRGMPYRNALGEIVGTLGAFTDITARKRSEGILRTIAERLSAATGEQFFALLVQHTAEALGVDRCFVGELEANSTDRVKTIAAWAHGRIAENFAYSLVGAPCENVVGKTVCFFPDRVAQLFPRDTALAKKGIRSYLGTPLFSSAGRPLGLMVVMHTKALASAEPAQSMLRICAIRAAAELERLRTESALRASEERYRLLVENSQGFICAHTLEGTLLSVNAASAAALGYEPHELVGRNLSDFLAPAVRHLFPAYMDRIRQNPTDSGLMRLVCKDGEERIWLFRNFRYDEPGKPSYVVGHAVDLTEQKKAEIALRESEERYRTVAQTATDCIVTIDGDSRILFANDATTRIFGYNPEELIGQELTLLMPDYLRQLHKRAVGRYLATGQRHIVWESVPLPGLHKSGREIPLEVSFGESVKGGRRFFTGIIRDVTERKQAEQLQTAVYRIAEAAGKTATLDDLYRSVHEIIREVMPAGSFYIALYDEKEDLLRFPYFVDEVDSPPAPRKPRRGVTEYVLRTGQPLLSTVQVHEELTRAGEIELVGSMSPIWLGVPLKLGEKTIGVMAVQHYTDAAAYGQREQRVLEYVSSQLAKAIEQKRAQEALRQSEEKFSRAFHSSPDAMTISTYDDSRFVEVNESFLRMTGYTREEVLGRTSLELGLWVDPEHRARMSSAVRQGGSLHELEFEMRAKSGETKIGLLSVDVIDVGGQRCFLSVVRDITERKRMEQALRRSEEKFSKAFFASPDAVSITTLHEGRFVDVNDTFLRLSGFTREEVLGRTGLKLNLWANPQDRETVLQRLREHGSVRNFECVFRNKAGEIVIGLVSAELFDYAGEPSMLSVVHDITDRVKMEEALRNSENKFAKAFFSSPDAMLIHTLAEGRIIDVNDTFMRLSGYTREEVVGRTGLELNVWVNPTDREAVVNALRTQGSVRNLECAFRTKAGEVLIGLVSAEVIEFGGVPCMLAVMRDITDRKQMEEALRFSEERYRELFENANDIIYTHDLAGNFTSLNRAGEFITGYARDDVYRMNITDVVLPDHRDRARQMIERKMAGEGPTTYELDIYSKDGRRITLEVSTRLIYHDGAPVGVQGLARDITERRTLEAQLRQAQKMEAVGRLAGGVAHDFNNLLMVIRGYNELILDRLAADDPMRRSAEQIEKAADRAASLTQQLLAYSRRQVVAPQVLDLNNVVENVEKMLRRLIGEDIELKTRLARGLGSVRADRGQIEQILLNLAVNARDAMPRGGKLAIETANAELDAEYARQYPATKPGSYVLLAVSDTGVGISAEDQAHIFEPFFTTKEVGKGTGLGLATVYGIVKQSNGYVWCYSEPGMGTTFKIYLPRVDQPAELLEGPKVSTGPARRSETILVVEDEDNVRELARQFLGSKGFVVLEASDGKQALEVSRTHPGPIHLLMTDVVMPGMSGRELAERLVLLRPQIKVLYVSGYTDEAIGNHGILDPGTEFLQKPFSREALSRKLSEILGEPERETVSR